MSSNTPQQSPLDRAKAEMATLDQELDTDLDKFRTSFLKEYEAHVNSLKTSFKQSQQSVISKAETALKSSDAHNRRLRENLQGERQRLRTQTSELSFQKQEAKIKHDQVTAELASQKTLHRMTILNLDKAKIKLEEASRRATGLEEDLQAVKQRNVDLQAEVESAKRQPADLQERLKAVQQQNADLEAALKAATQRASTAEHELKGFKSLFKRINDDVTALASSSEQQLTVSQPVPSSALPAPKQGSVEERQDGPQEDDHRVRTQSPDPHASNPTIDKEPDLMHCQSILNEVTDKTNSLANNYFLRPMLSPTLKCRGVIVGPMYLSTLKEKLAKGLYPSSNSLKADFDHMIADWKRLNQRHSQVCTAVEQLARVFEETWSAERTSGDKSKSLTSQDQESRSHKRKASTEDPVSSESDGKAKKAREGSSLNDNAFQPMNPVADECVHPASSPTESQSATTAAGSVTRQDSPKGAVETEPDQQQSNELVLQPTHMQQMGETDRLLCEEVLHTVRNDITIAHDIHFFLASSGHAQPMNLTIIDKKLREGSYISVDSFREDFHSMIKLYKARNSPILREASNMLETLFEDTWNVYHGPDSAALYVLKRDLAAVYSNNRGHKRKASTERPVTSEDSAKHRRAPSPPHLSKDSTQPTGLVTSEDDDNVFCVKSDLIPERHSRVWRGKVTATSYFAEEIPVEFNVAANPVSVHKSPKIFTGPWTDLIPSELCLQAGRRLLPGVNKHLDYLDFELVSDTFVLRLAPSAQRDKKTFRRLYRDLDSRGRYAQVNHGSVSIRRGGLVVSLHLIPASTSLLYPHCLSGLDKELLASLRTQKSLLLVVGLHLRPAQHRQLEMAWDQVFQALRTHEHTKAIVDARDRIVHHSLPVRVPGWSMMSFAKEYKTLLDGLPFSQSGSSLAPGSGEFLSLAYSRPDKVGDVELPSRVFVLGGMMSGAKLSGLVVVDLEHKNRPLWEICKEMKSNTLGDSMRLLRSKLPGSFSEWRWAGAHLVEDVAGIHTRAEDPGLKIERCGCSD